MAKSNVQRCNDYKKKQELLGVMTFDFEVDTENDRVTLTEYVPNEEEYSVIELPSFVTDIKVARDSIRDTVIRSVLSGVKQSLKIIHRENQIETLEGVCIEFS